MVSAERRTGRRTERRTGRPTGSGLAGLVTGCALAGAALAGCSGGSDDPPAAAGGSTAPAASATSGSAPATTAAPTTGPSGTGTGTGTAPAATPAITVAATPFEAPARYGDGVQVAVTAVKQGTVTATGPGELTGQPYTSFRITFTNRSAKALDLTQVVVSVTYGPQKLAAVPVYGDVGVADFASTIGAGRAAAALYAFSIPKARLGAVTMRVDFAADHQPATFVGKVAPPG